VSLLEPVRPNDLPGRVQSPPPPVIVDDHEEYEVEEVLDSRESDGKLKYRVRWKNYPPSEDSWEPPENLANAQNLVDEFHRAYPDKPRPRVRAHGARPQRGANCHESPARQSLATPQKRLRPEEHSQNGSPRPKKSPQRSSRQRPG
jgi:hypothetical protein